MLNFIMLVISLISLALCNSVRKSICRKFLVPVYFRTIFGLFCSDIIYHHKIDNFPGKITFFINGSVNSKHALSPRAFVGYLSFCFGKAANAARSGLKLGYKCPTPRQHQWEFCNNLIRGEVQEGKSPSSLLFQPISPFSLLFGAISLSSLNLV